MENSQIKQVGGWKKERTNVKYSEHVIATQAIIKLKPYTVTIKPIV